MKTIKSLLLAFAIGLSFLFISGIDTPANAATSTPAVQIVPKAKHYTRRGYNRSRRATVTTWHKGKRVTKKTWRTTNRFGHKVVHKTKRVVMGPSKRNM
jgi:hypothetical protein